MPLSRLARRTNWPHLPRRSIRLRLTAIYGGLFLVSGAGLLSVTYVLVRNATGGGLCHASGNTVVCNINTAHGRGYASVVAVRAGAGAKHIASGQLRQLGLLVRSENANDLHQLLLYSGLALAVMAVFSVVLGWLIAGRVLRPLRTITATARTISGTNLHRRVAMDGPNDELRELGDTFDELLARLETFVVAQRQFVANASHELRTPLALQRTLIQVALADPDADAASLRAAHERVLASGSQQERLLEALLTLTRGQTGLDANTRLDLATVVDEVLAARRVDAERSGLEIHASLMPAPMSGDPRLVERLVANLVDNAIRYNVDGGRVEVATSLVDGRARLTVHNTGPVVAPDEVASLTRPFERPPSARARHAEGFGLGLSIVAAIAEAHGAEMSINAPLGGGLVVNLVFAFHDAGERDGSPALTLEAAVAPGAPDARDGQGEPVAPVFGAMAVGTVRDPSATSRR